MAALKYWIWLTALPGVPNRTKLRLLEQFASPENIYYAAPEELALTPEIKRSHLAALENKSLAAAEQVLDACGERQIRILTMQDAAYPERLKNIYDPPVLLYWKGQLPRFDEEAAVAVVGTRSCTPYGVRTARRLGREFAEQGALVVSGMAAGIDGAAHSGALEGGGVTAAVLGCGVDVIYPQENRRIYEDIAATGVLLSEYPPGTEAVGRHFPIRNRIISGLSLATVVVEAPEKSGALITANTALEQGREVFAVPGAIDAPTSRGCNELIREGAGLVRESWDVLESFAAQLPQKLRRTAIPAQAADFIPAAPPRAAAVPERPVLDLKNQPVELTDDQCAVLRAMRSLPALLPDEAAEACGLPVRRVLSALTMLEIDGYVCAAAGGRFICTVEVKE